MFMATGIYIDQNRKPEAKPDSSSHSGKNFYPIYRVMLATTLAQHRLCSLITRPQAVVTRLLKMAWHTANTDAMWMLLRKTTHLASSHVFLRYHCRFIHPPYSLVKPNDNYGPPSSEDMTKFMDSPCCCFNPGFCGKMHRDLHNMDAESAKLPHFQTCVTSFSKSCRPTTQREEYINRDMRSASRSDKAAVGYARATAEYITNVPCFFYLDHTRILMDS
jgi:hypothetical protein